MQIRDNVNAANFLAVGMGTSTKSNADTQVDSDFASFLNKSDDKADSIKDGVSAEKELFPERKNLDKKNVDKKNANNNKVDSKNEDNKSNNDSSIRKTEVKKDSDNLNNENTDDKVISGNIKANYVEADDTTNIDVLPVGTTLNAVDLDEETIEKVMELFGDVLQVIMNQFDMSAPEVVDAVSEMGMEFSDIITEEGEKTFFLDMKSADISDLLTNETLSTELNDFTTQVEAIVNSKPEIQEYAALAIEEDVISNDDIKKIVIDNDHIDTDMPAITNNDDTSDEEITENVMVDRDNDEIQKPVVEVNVDTGRDTSSDNPSDDSRIISDKKERNSNTNTNTKTELQNTIFQEVSAAVNDITEAAEIAEPAAARQVDIVTQIVEQIRVNINQDNTSLEMQLYPEHLGRIQIHVVSKDGVMTARIAAETEAAKQAIEAGLNNLKESLNNQNLKVDAIEVMVSTTGFADSDERREQYQQEANNNRRNGRGFGFDDTEEDEEIEAADVQKMQAEGSSVSYRA